MLFVVRSNDSFNFSLGLIKYIVIVVIVTVSVTDMRHPEEPSVMAATDSVFYSRAPPAVTNGRRL